jgi:hypothetical protein
MQPSGKVKDTLSCKRCGDPAERRLSTPGFKFAHVPDAPAPQNTGASSVDHDVDVVIGRSAEANLREFQRRQDYKRRVIAAEGTTGEHLSRLDGGEYFVMTPDERRAAKRARIVNQEVMHRYKVWRERRGASSEEAAR